MPVCFLTRNRKGVDLYERGNMEELEGVREEETELECSFFQNVVY